MPICSVHLSESVKNHDSTAVKIYHHGTAYFEVYQETIDMEISDCEVMQKALKRLYDFETKQLA